MKVKELIEKLSEYDGEREVMFMRDPGRGKEFPVHKVYEVGEIFVIPGDSEDRRFKAVVLMNVSASYNTKNY